MYIYMTVHVDVTVVIEVDVLYVRMSSQFSSW